MRPCYITRIPKVLLFISIYVKLLRWEVQGIFRLDLVFVIKRIEFNYLDLMKIFLAFKNRIIIRTFVTGRLYLSILQININKYLLFFLISLYRYLPKFSPPRNINITLTNEKSSIILIYFISITTKPFPSPD